MKKFLLVSLAITQVVIVIGVVLIVVGQSENQKQVKAELGDLRSTSTSQEGHIRDLDQNHRAVMKQIDATAASLQLISEQLISLGSKQETKFESISTKIAEKPVIQPLRWAYVDKFKLQRIATSTLKTEALPSEQDPDKNPVLAQKWMEYQSIQARLNQLNSMERANSFSSGGGNDRTGGKKKADEYGALQSQLADLRVPLLAYLNHKSSGMAGEQELMDRAIQEYAKEKFDLLIDKTFGDHHIYYRSPQPVPDVTDAVAEVLREMAAK